MFAQYTNGTHSTLSGRRWGNSEVLKLQEFWFSPACAASWHWPSDRALCHLIRHGLAQATTLSGLHWGWAGLVFPPQPHFTATSTNSQRDKPGFVSKTFFTSTVNHTKKKWKTITELPYPFWVFFQKKQTNKKIPNQTSRNKTKNSACWLSLIKSLVSFRMYTNCILNIFECCLPPCISK